MTTLAKSNQEPTALTREGRRRLVSIACAGITFQGGSAAVDSSTIMAALVYQLTGSSVAVGAVTAVLRFGWLFPQLIVGFLAQKRASSMRYYAIGGFGRAACLALLSAVLFTGSEVSAFMLSVVVLLLWTAYSFVSGIVAVPYNDIVARSVSSGRRSRLLATRFFGGGLLALGIAVIANGLVGNLPFPVSYAAIIAAASGLMFVSSIVFVSMGEPEAEVPTETPMAFFEYLREGITVFRTDNRFRLFVYAQWFGGAVLMALPFYVVQATAIGFDLRQVALLLGAQTAGSLASNALWGWWGDRRGKGSLLQAVALGRVIPPVVILILVSVRDMSAVGLLICFMGTFFILGALANGLTIAVIGYLMEISPEEKRPAYSGYFNALTAPAFLFPLVGGVLAAAAGLAAVFALSLVAACLQFFLVRRLRKSPGIGDAASPSA